MQVNTTKVRIERWKLRRGIEIIERVERSEKTNTECRVGVKKNIPTHFGIRDGQRPKRYEERRRFTDRSLVRRG